MTTCIYDTQKCLLHAFLSRGRPNKGVRGFWTVCRITLLSAGTRRDRWQFGILRGCMSAQCMATCTGLSPTTSDLWGRCTTLNVPLPPRTACSRHGTDLESCVLHAAMQSMCVEHVWHQQERQELGALSCKASAKSSAVTGSTESVLPWGFQAYFDQGLLSCKLKCYRGRLICVEGRDCRL